jgi:acyl carrier protein
MTAELGKADLARMARFGIEALGEERGLALFDSALAAGSAQAVAIALNRSGLRAQAAAGSLPPMLSSLVKVPARRRASGSLAAKLAALPEAEREGAVLDLVRAEVAAVLGHGSGAQVDPDRAFKELGFDSLAAVELRNRLNLATGLRLQATTVFDYPSAGGLASRIGKLLSPGDGSPQSNGKEDQIRRVLAGIPLERLEEAGVLQPLLELAGDTSVAASSPEAERIAAIAGMDSSDLVRLAMDSPTEADQA